MARNNTVPQKAAPRQTAPRQAETAEQEVGLQPPEEQFWQRYSPHGEAPLSGAGSLTLHLLILGVLLLGFFGLLPLGGSKHNIQIEPVRLGLNQGGGGGKRSGVGEGPGIGSGREVADASATESKGLTDTLPLPLPELPDPSSPTAREDLKFEGNTRPIFASESMQALRKLNKEALAKLPRVGLTPGKGRGGSGKGGGLGQGEGTGTGDGKGESTNQANLTKREKRMLRWVMRFDTRSGADYVAQLKGLGAILAIPTQEVPGDYRYQLVRDLRPGAKLLDEDVSKINRIYWVDQKPESVREVMAFLNLRMSPSHFVAFMPAKLEQQLFELESRYLERHYPGATEDDITVTRFQVVPSPSRRTYVPELLNLEVRR
jgi:hypothetical protein